MLPDVTLREGMTGYSGEADWPMAATGRYWAIAISVVMRAAAATGVELMNIVLQNLADLSEIERRIAFGLRTCQDQRDRMASLEAGGRDAADERALLEATEEIVTLMKAYRSVLVERLLADGYVPTPRGQKH